MVLKQINHSKVKYMLTINDAQYMMRLNNDTF